MRISLEPRQKATLVASPTEGQWLWWSAMAILSTLAHTLIDAHIGLWGDTSNEMDFAQASNTVAQGAVYGWWFVATVFASHGDRWALRSVLLMTGVNAFLFHGLIAIIAAPPFSTAFPYQDLAHISSLVTGGVAAVLIRQHLREIAAGGRRYLFVGTVATIILSQGLSGLTFVLSL